MYLLYRTLAEQHDGEHRAERVSSEGEIKHVAHGSLLLPPFSLDK
jgi:hypothetical protein